MSIVNLKNTSKTYLYLLNFKTEKLTLGTFITISFLTGLASTTIFSYLTSQRNENNVYNSKKLDLNPDVSLENSIENNTQNKEYIDERPPERNIRDSRPTISVNYRVIKQNNMEVNDIDKEYTDKTYQINDDWKEIESNW